MSDAAASDDSDLRGIAHIGTIVSTSSIAVAERTGASGRDVLAAMVYGYEIAGRIDEALTPGRSERGFHGSISTIFGGAVAAGTLLELTQGQMTQAIALARTRGSWPRRACSKCRAAFSPLMAEITWRT